MLVYIITFAISLWATFMADRNFGHKNVCAIFSIMAIVPPVLIAGLRGSTVGSDMTLYILPIFDDLVGSNQSFNNFRDSHEEIEILYILINYLVGLFSNNTIVLLTTIHLLIIIPFYITVMKWRKLASPTFALFIYYCTFYQETLSIVRQSISLSFSLLAFTYFVERKYLKYVIFFLISFGFHRSSVLTLILPILYVLFKEYPITKHSITYIACAFIFVLPMMNIENNILWLVDSGLIDTKYLIYTSAYGFSPRLGATNLVVKIILLLFIIIMVMRYKNTYLEFFFLGIACLDLGFSLLALLVEPLDRLSLCFRLMACFSIPFFIEKARHRPSHIDLFSKTPFKLFFIFLFFFFWYYLYILGDFYST